MQRWSRYFGVGLLLTVAAAGCSSTRWGFVKNDTPKPAVAGDVPSVAALVDYLNNNANRMDSLHVEHLDMTCTHGSQSFGVSGHMVTQKPRNFRLGAKAVGNPVVDLGSNDNEFWYWIGKAKPPYQVFCSYQDLHDGRVRRMPFPFQPEWVMESMGFGTPAPRDKPRLPYGPPEKYKLEHDRDTLRLVEKSVSSQGQPIRKVIVLRRHPVQPPHPQVTDYLLVDDATGKEICGAKIKEIKIDRHTGAIVPYHMELRWPSEELKLTMWLKEHSLNQPPVPGVFVRRPMHGVQSFNLATLAVDNTPPPQAFSDAGGLKTVQGLAP